MTREHDRDILRLAGPALLTLLAEPAYLLADTAVVGHLGTSQLGGLAVASSVLLTGHSLCIFLAYGTTAAVARLLGAGERREAGHQAVQGCWLGFGLGVVLSVVAYLASEWLVGLLGAEGAVAANALVYLRISLIGFPLLLVTLAGTGYLRGIKDTRTPLLVTVGTALFNLVLELILVQGFGYGIGASALATVAAQAIGAAVYLRAVDRAARPEGVGWRPDPAALRRLLRVGVDLVIRTAALRGSLVALTAIATRIGTAEVAAHQIVSEIHNTAALALDSLAIAAQAMVGQLLGAGRLGEARAVANRLIRWGLVMAGVIMVVLVVLMPFAPGVFTSDLEVAHLVRFLLWWSIALQPVASVAYVLDGVLIGAGDQRFLARSMVVAAAVLVALAVPILPLDLGIGWVWLAFAGLLIARAVLLLVRLRRERWLVGGARLPAPTA